jgi:tripartite-type tricarboxylate transporter receptor subunit TctC
MSFVAKVLLAALVLMVATIGVFAQEYPTRPLRIIVPYAAGGPSDTGARLAGEALSQQLGKPVVIENRGGGGGLNATEAYLNIEPDGYTILVGAIGPFTIIPAAKQVSYDIKKDFVPLGTVWRSAQVLAVRKSMPAKTMAEFVAYAKSNPGKVTIGSAGVGAVTHLAIELLKHEAGIDVIHIPFRSTSESLPALIGGQIDALFGDGPIIAPQVHSDIIKALAVAAPDRVSALPEVPTTAEAGFPRVIAESWYGLVVSSRVSPAIISRLQQALVIAQKDPTYKGKLAKLGASAGELGPESFAKLILSDTEKWRAIIKAAGIKIN